MPDTRIFSIDLQRIAMRIAAVVLFVVVWGRFLLNAQSAEELARLESALVEPQPKLQSVAEPNVNRRTLPRHLFRAYQAAFSKHLTNACPFSPNCQTYARQAFDELPTWDALALSFDRMSRCNRLVILLEGVRNHELRQGQLYDPLP